MSIPMKKNESYQKSTLYNLEPIGEGTAYQESLCSYITRIAEAHSVKTGDLFSSTLFPYLNRPYMNRIISDGGNGFYDSGHIINGLSSIATTFVDMMNALTGNNHLTNLTMLRFSNVLSTRGLLKNNKSWCPVCYEETKDTVSYDPLIWSLKQVTVCIKHKVYLYDLCPTCFKVSKVIERRSEIGYCNHCSSWLGMIISEELVDEWDMKRAVMISELFIHNSFEKNNVMNSIQKLVSAVTNGSITEFAKRNGLPKSTLWTWYNGRNLPTIEDAVILCNKYGIRLVDFYKNTISFKEVMVYLVRRKKKINEHITESSIAQVGKLLELVLIDNTKVNITVKELARLTKCNKKNSIDITENYVKNKQNDI